MKLTAWPSHRRALGRARFEEPFGLERIAAWVVAIVVVTVTPFAIAPRGPSCPTSSPSRSDSRAWLTRGERVARAHFERTLWLRPAHSWRP